MIKILNTIGFIPSSVFIFVFTVLSVSLQSAIVDFEKQCTSSGDQDSLKNLNFSLYTSDFKKLRLYSTVFVDKSEMISEYLARGGIVLTITRPMKWGKSLNIDMFKTFFEIEVDRAGVPISDENRINRVLFAGGNVTTGCGIVHLKPLKVSNYSSAMDHQGNNPVILISLKEITGKSIEEFQKSMEDKIISLYSEYPYLVKYVGNETHPFTIEEGEKWEEKIFHRIKLKSSIHYLSKLLFKHFKRNVYVFIDDYDSPINNAYITFGAKSEEFNKVLDMTYGIVGKALKDNWFLERAVLIGTFHFGWLNEILKLHDVRHSTIVDMTFSNYFGFTANEVNDMFGKFKVPVDPIQLKIWYNGYNFDGIFVYNPWSVLSCISNRGNIDYYWGKLIKASNSLMDKVYLMDEPQDYLQKLLQDGSIIRKEINKPINLLKMEDTFHRVLLFGGFFNSVPGFCESNCYIHPWNLSIPNLEVRGILAEGMSKWVANKLNISSKELNSLTKYLTDYEIDGFLQDFKKFLFKAVIPKTPEEHQLHHHKLFGGIISSLANNYKIESSRKAGQKSREYVLTSLFDKGKNKIVIDYEVIKSQKKMDSAVEVGMKKLIKREIFCSKNNTNKDCSKLLKIYLVLCKRKVKLKYTISEFS